MSRIEKDCLGQMEVPDDVYYGIQTLRVMGVSGILGEKVIKYPYLHRALVQMKKAAALANKEIGALDERRAEAIAWACDKVLTGKYDDQFPLDMFQGGGYTCVNMNVNEVIAHLAADQGVMLHPNDHANRSQSSNDTFPSALHISAVLMLEREVLPTAKRLATAFGTLEEKYPDLIEIGRTHLQDATPLKFSQEVSGWRELVLAPCRMMESALSELRKLAIGGTAVGTGLNAPDNFDTMVCEELTSLTGTEFVPDNNKFHALTSKDALVFAHGALKALACNLMKIANDIRWKASGPRCGMGELNIPENEPGSSIMPGKVNPTQCEAVTMVAVQVMGADVTLGVAASQGNFQLNVFLPVCAYNFALSARLLADAMDSFRVHCVDGITANEERMRKNLDNSLMLVTCLTPKIGYEMAAQCAKKALKEGISLRDATVSLGLLTETEFEQTVRPENMV